MSSISGYLRQRDDKYETPTWVRLIVTVDTFKPLRSNTLVGFADIVIGELDHLRIQATAIHESQDNRWIELPAHARCDDRVVVLQFGDQGTANAFVQRVITALVEAFPDAFKTLVQDRPTSTSRS